jgi:phage terminase small subunit
VGVGISISEHFLKKGERALESEKSRKAKTTRAFNKTVENMRAVGTYKPEFEASVRRYVEMRIQYDILNEKWYENGCKITEEYVNKSGAKNQRKTALYLSMEAMRRELIEMENLFGLTPKGLRAIKAKGLEQKHTSALDQALEKMNE